MGVVIEIGVGFSMREAKLGYTLVGRQGAQNLYGGFPAGHRDERRSV